jgi:hypothetical protein
MPLPVIRYHKHQSLNNLKVVSLYLRPNNFSQFRGARNLLSVTFTVTMPYKTIDYFAAGNVAEDIKMVTHKKG